jgi:hypothetical protein
MGAGVCRRQHHGAEAGDDGKRRMLETKRVCQHRSSKWMMDPMVDICEVVGADVDGVRIVFLLSGTHLYFQGQSHKNMPLGQAHSQSI